jgi:hypothetical protein
MDFGAMVGGGRNCDTITDLTSVSRARVEEVAQVCHLSDVADKDPTYVQLYTANPQREKMAEFVALCEGAAKKKREEFLQVRAAAQVPRHGRAPQVPHRICVCV